MLLLLMLIFSYTQLNVKSQVGGNHKLFSIEYIISVRNHMSGDENTNKYFYGIM